MSKRVFFRSAFPSLAPALAASLSICLLLTGCGLAISPEERLANAGQAYSDGQYRAAIIDTKNILLDDPDNVTARVLLGRASLRVGDGVAAEKELRRALGLGVEKPVIAVDLMRAMLLQGRYAQVIDENDPAAAANSADRAQLQRILGDAYLGNGEPEVARNEYTKVLDIDSSDRAAMLGIVDTYVTEGNFIQARATLTEVLQMAEDFAQAWVVSGQLHQRSGDFQSAERDFKRAIGFAQDDAEIFSRLQALSGLTEVSLASRKIEDARRYAAQLSELAPGNVRSLQLAARIAQLDGDLALAQEKLLDVLRRVPNDAKTRLLLGAVHLQNGNLGQAEMYLSAVVADQPSNVDARRLLAQARLRLDKIGDAQEVLSPVVDADSADTQSLALAARVSLESGNVDAATAYLERSARLDSSDTLVNLDLAVAYLMAGRVEDARNALAIVETANSEEADFRRGFLSVLAAWQEDLAAGLAEAQALREAWPGRPSAHTLQGVLLFNGEQYDAARAALQAAQAVAPGDPGSLRYLARVDEAEGKPADAEARYLQVLNSGPDDVDAMIALARLAARKDAPDESLDWLRKARAADGSAIAPRIYLGRILAFNGKFDEAAEISAEALAIRQDIPELHNINGLALLGLDDAAGALTSFEKAIELDPGNSEYRLNLARAYAVGGDEARAQQTLEASDDALLEHLPSAVVLARLKAENGDYQEAERIAARLRDMHPNSAVPLVLLAELRAQAESPAAAVQLYDEALRMDLNPRYALRAFNLRRQSGSSNAEAPLVYFLEHRPENVTVRLALATHYQTGNAPDAAVAAYEDVLALDAENFIALNNLAWAYFERGDSRAEEIARRAYAIAPENGSVVDTLGWILVQKGQVDEGVRLLRDATRLSDGADIQFHLAAGLAASGNTDEARTILEGLLASEPAFNSRNEAQQLLSSL